MRDLLLGVHGLDGSSRVRLWTLEGHTQSTVPDQLGQHSETTGDTEENGVEVLLNQTIGREEDTRVGIDVGPGVLGLAVLEENAGSDGVDLGDELEEGIVGDVLQGELTLASVTGIGLAENGVTVTGNNLAALEGLPDVLLDGLVRDILATELLAHLGDPAENLLVGQSVEGTSKTVQTGSEGEVRVREGRADQVSGVGRDVTTLVIRVDGEVKTHELNKVLVLAESEEVGQVGTIIQVGVDGGDLGAVLEDVLVDATGNVGELGNEIHGILEGGVPVLLLVDALLVSLGELRVVLESSDGQRELGHGVEGVGASVEEILNEGGESSAIGPLGRETLDLLVGGDLTGDQKPEEGLGEGLLATLGSGEDSLALGDGLAAETDTLLRVEDGTLPDETLDATHTTVSHINGGLAQDLATELGLDLLDLLALLGDQLAKAILQGLQKVRKREKETGC